MGHDGFRIARCDSLQKLFAPTCSSRLEFVPNHFQAYPELRLVGRTSERIMPTESYWVCRMISTTIRDCENYVVQTE